MVRAHGDVMRIATIDGVGSSIGCSTCIRFGGNASIGIAVNVSASVVVRKSRNSIRGRVRFSVRVLKHPPRLRILAYDAISVDHKKAVRIL